MTKTTHEKTYLKLSEELNPTFGKAHAAVQDIIEAQEEAEGIQSNIGALCDTLFAEVVSIQKTEGQSATEIFNVLAYLGGFDYIAAEDGTPNIAGKKNKRPDGAWPKGSLSTYRAQCQKAERPKNQGGLGKKVSDFPTFKELRAEVNPRNEPSQFDKAIKEFKAAKLTAANRKAIEKAILATLEKELKATLAAAETKAAPKSHAKKKAA